MKSKKGSLNLEIAKKIPKKAKSYYLAEAIIEDIKERKKDMLHSMGIDE